MRVYGCTIWMVGFFSTLDVYLVYILYYQKRFTKRNAFIKLCFVIFGAAGHFYFDHYWTPFHVIKLFGWDIGVEDFLYTFSIAGLGAVSYEFFFRKVDVKRKKKTKSELRKIELLLSGTAGLAFFLFLDHLTSWNLIVTSGIGLAFIGIFLIYFRRDLLFPLVLNGLVFALLVVLLEFLTELIFPGFSDLWIEENTIGLQFLGFPIEELIFHFGWGMGLGSLFELYYDLSDK